MSIVLKQLTIPLCDLRLQRSVSYSELNNIQFKKTELKKKNGIKRNQVKEESGEDEEEKDYEVKKKKRVERVKNVLLKFKRNEKKEKFRKVQDVLLKSKHSEEIDEDTSSEEEDNTDNDPDFYTEGEDHEDTSSEDDNDDEDTSSEEEDNTDNDADFYTEKKKKNIKLVQDVHLKSKHNILSAYEQMIKKNQEEKMAILQSLKLDEAKANLAEVLQKKSQPRKRKFTKTEKDTSPPILRKSRRLANFNVDLSENTLYFNALKAATGEQNRKIRMPKNPFKEDLESLEGYESFVRAFNIHKSTSEYRHFSYNKTKKDTSPVLRKSRRLAKTNVDLSEDTLYYNTIKAAVEELNRKA